jgi:hypothetical protein
VKHVILMTDGIADSNYADLIDRMRADKTTITIVSIGSDANPALEQIAERGGGRYYRVERLGDVPRIFLAETVLVAGRDIVEGAFTPAISLPAPVVRGLDGLPPLYGYNATERRPAARTILVTPDGKPVLAQWQYGLGRSVAWTSDLKGQWARDWVLWGQFPRFVGGLLDTLLPPQELQGLLLEARADPGGGQAVLELNALDERGRPIEDLTLDGRLLDPAQQGVTLSFTQVGPGRYRAVAPAGLPGVYLAQVAALDNEGRPIGSASSGMVVSYSPEYSARRDNPQLLSDLAGITAGRQNPAPETLFTPVTQPVGFVQEIALPLLVLALLLWPLDIALRRLLLRRSDFAPLLGRLRPAPAQPASLDPTLARLRAAKAAAPVRRSLSGEASVSVASAPPPLPRAPVAPPPEPQAAEAEPPPAAPPESADPEESLARLLAAKQRARRKR